MIDWLIDWFHSLWLMLVFFLLFCYLQDFRYVYWISVHIIRCVCDEMASRVAK
jgi:hypothetical protein